VKMSEFVIKHTQLNVITTWIAYIGKKRKRNRLTH